MRSTWLVIPFLLLLGCSDDSAAPSPATGDGAVASSTVAPSVAPDQSAPLGTNDNVFAGTDVTQVCAEANRAAYAHAEQLGYWNHPLTAAEQLVYYQIRGGTVDVMVESLRALGSDASVDVEAAVTALGAYGDWVRSQAAAIEQTGATVSEDHGGILDTARSALGCSDLFDMN